MYRNKYIYEYAPTKRNFGVNASEVKELQFELKLLIETVRQYNIDYLMNVQSPFLEMEQQIVEEHKHEYPEYIELKRKEVERDKYIEEGKAKIKAIEWHIREMFK
ncbi:hypothetical protein LCGC14_1868210 [marine sediment metagenome]|uniref:Uncharacterized protein n=1 Tax=marine sediment metagenome TaxID=412755 RepID=A0A0F9GTU3_9ZZZZ